MAAIDRVGLSADAGRVRVALGKSYAKCGLLFLLLSEAPNGSGKGLVAHKDFFGDVAMKLLFEFDEYDLRSTMSEASNDLNRVIDKQGKPYLKELANRCLELADSMQVQSRVLALAVQNR